MNNKEILLNLKHGDLVEFKRDGEWHKIKFKAYSKKELDDHREHRLVKKADRTDLFMEFSKFGDGRRQSIIIDFPYTVRGVRSAVDRPMLGVASREPITKEEEYWIYNEVVYAVHMDGLLHV